MRKHSLIAHVSLERHLMPVNNHTANVNSYFLPAGFLQDPFCAYTETPGLFHSGAAASLIDHASLD